MASWFYTILVAWILLYLVWKLNKTAQYYMKFCLYATLSVLFATCPIPLMFFSPGSSKNALFPAAALRFCARYILGIKCKVTGKEHIVEDSGCVVVINHQSVIDLVVLAELWPVLDRCTVISKKEIFYIWPFGLAAWLWGTIFIDRLNGSKAKDSINKTGEIIRNRKARVLMFPEGTRSLKETLLPFKKGAFHLAVASKCPIQPVVVNRYTFLGHQRFDSGNIEICILPAIETKDLSPEDLPTVIDKTYQVMQNHLTSMSANEKQPTSNYNFDKPKRL